MLNRRLLMAQAGATPPGGGIVTDGLLMNMDCRDAKPGEPWLSRVGNIKFSVRGNEIEVTSSGIQLSPGDGHIESLSEGAPDFLISGTLQLCVNIHQFRNLSKLFSPATHYDSSEFSVGQYGSGVIISNTTKPMFRYTIPFNTNTTLSFNEDIIYDSLKPITERFGTDRYRGAGRVEICCYGNNTQIVGTLYACRYYSRKLTPEEIEQNYQHDLTAYYGGAL